MGAICDFFVAFVSFCSIFLRDSRVSIAFLRQPVTLMGCPGRLVKSTGVASMGHALQTRLQPVRFRQQLVRAIWLSAWGLLAGSVAALVCAILKYLALPELAGWLAI